MAKLWESATCFKQHRSCRPIRSSTETARDDPSRAVVLVP
jgi:hypothetical protein